MKHICWNRYNEKHGYQLQWITSPVGGLGAGSSQPALVEETVGKTFQKEALSDANVPLLVGI